MDTTNPTTGSETDGLRGVKNQPDESPKVKSDKNATCEISASARATGDHVPGAEETQSADEIKASSEAVAEGTAPDAIKNPSAGTQPEGDTHQLLTQREAWAAVIAVRDKSGPLSKTSWVSKSTAVLKASLEWLYAFGNDEQARTETQKRLKYEAGRKRAPNKANSEYLAVLACHKPGTRIERSEFSRFAKVVKIARHRKVKPNEAAAWLENNKQSDLLKAARALNGKAPIKPIVVTSKRVRPNIWKALKAGEGDAYKLAIGILDGLDHELAQKETLLGEGAGQAQPSPDKAK